MNDKLTTPGVKTLEPPRGNGSELKPLLCGCGREVRYSHFKDGEEVMSCNKRIICLTYEEQREKLTALQGKYSELLYAVARKFPGENRHETALRYIRAMEEAPSHKSAQCEAT